MIIKKQFLPFVTLFLSFFLPAEKIKINNSVLEVLIADTKQSRNQGLMFIDSLDENMGMFFIWSESSKKCMWMRNTKIPLSVAFIDENFLIREIKELKPLNLDSVCSKSGSIKYALEVNQGWFAEKNIKIFNKIIVE